MKIARRFIAGSSQNGFPVPVGRMKLLGAWRIKRPSGTRPFSPTNPAMNRRAALGHSSGTMEYFRREFRKSLSLLFFSPSLFSLRSLLPSAGPANYFFPFASRWVLSQLRCLASLAWANCVNGRSGRPLHVSMKNSSNSSSVTSSLERDSKINCVVG